MRARRPEPESEQYICAGTKLARRAFLSWCLWSFGVSTAFALRIDSCSFFYRETAFYLFIFPHSFLVPQPLYRLGSMFRLWSTIAVSVSVGMCVCAYRDTLYRVFVFFKLRRRRRHVRPAILFQLEASGYHLMSLESLFKHECLW